MVTPGFLVLIIDARSEREMNLRSEYVMEDMFDVWIVETCLSVGMIGASRKSVSVGRNLAPGARLIR
jgi:hypothetical protein